MRQLAVNQLESCANFRSRLPRALFIHRVSLLLSAVPSMLKDRIGSLRTAGVARARACRQPPRHVERFCWNDLQGGGALGEELGPPA